MNNKIVILLIAISILSSCKKVEKEAKDIDFGELVMEWNNAHTSKDVAVFSNLYNDSVLFYGTSLGKNTCIENKLAFFKKNPDFTQNVIGKIEIKEQEKKTYRCNFVKQISINGKLTDFPSYLIFENKDDKWVIITESDNITDENLAKKQSINIPRDAVSGDFDGDGIKEYMWIVAPKIADNETDCIGDCNSYIHFSNPKIPTIKIENCIGGTPDNLGDLNKNKTDEIGLSPDWFTSCWKAYYVWTLKNDKWIYAVEPFSTHCQQWEEGVKPIEIDPKHDGYVIIRYSEFINDNSDLVTSSKSVKIVK